MSQNAPESQDSHTTRHAVAKLDARLGQMVKVLDHGFVRVIDYMGDDNAVVQAARVSYGRGTKTASDDQALINYLMRHHHNTPFEMCVIKFHIKLPIFVARQWIRHRTASVNEYSARYSIMGNDYYVPERKELKPQSLSNRQGRDGNIHDEDAKEIEKLLQSRSQQAYDDYQKLLNEDSDGNEINHNRHGLSRELARMVLPLNYYTEWYWSCNLHNLLHFLQLRLDAHAQYEIRVYAEVMYDVVKDWVPMTAAAFEKFRKEAINLSKDMLTALFMLVKAQPSDVIAYLEQNNTYSLSKREIREVANIYARETHGNI
ncbi:MAG: FAD-dependent thymidylate synthase [Candidatus Symbiobacter sp.]|nr:FAD-dependent thymidylate synthase [Candidatus Symbiobacter sp.]